MSKLKLLTKREIDVARAKDRQQEVVEGAKLAKRVDDLRKIVPEEEKRIEEFRKSAVARINGEIASLINERDKIKAEVLKLAREWSDYQFNISRAKDLIEELKQ